MACGPCPAISEVKSKTSSRPSLLTDYMFVLSLEVAMAK